MTKLLRCGIILSVKIYPKVEKAMNVVDENVNFDNKDFPVLTFFNKICLPTAVSQIPMRHPQLEIKYYVKGGCDILCDDEIIRVGEGDIVIISPFQMHSTRNIDNVCEYHLLMFDLQFLFSHERGKIDIDYLLPIRDGKIVLKNHIKSDEAVHRVIIELFEDLQRKSNGYELFVKGALYKVLGNLLEDEETRKIDNIKWTEYKKYKASLAPVFQYIDEHYNEKITLEMLAKVCNFSTKYFCKIFKDFTSLTPFDYVNRHRLYKAELDILSSTKTLAEIAEENGFCDVSHFSRYYKKVRGFSPSQLRNNK